jgi:hypothetical protein
MQLLALLFLRVKGITTLDVPDGLGCALQEAPFRAINTHDVTVLDRCSVLKPFFHINPTKIQKMEMKIASNRGNHIISIA